MFDIVIAVSCPALRGNRLAGRWWDIKRGNSEQLIDSHDGQPVGPEALTCSIRRHRYTTTELVVVGPSGVRNG